MGHAKDSPSGLYRTLLCPASRNRGLKYKGGKSSPAAREGTIAHALLEDCLRNGVDPDQVSQVLIEGEKDLFPVDDDMRDGVQVALNYLEKEGYFTDSDTLSSELEVDPEPLTGVDAMSGTVDIVAQTPIILEIADFKYGQGILVLPENNSQLIMYAAGVLATSKTFVDEVRMTIIQPRIPNRLGLIRSWTIPAVDVISRAKEIAQAVEAARKPGASVIPSDEACKWCPARGDCKERAEFATNTLQSMFALEDGETDMVAGLMAKAGQAPGEMDSDMIAQYLDSAPIIEKFIKDLKEEAKVRLEAGKSIVGYKLVSGKSSRKWALAEDELRKKLKSIGFKHAQYIKESLITPAAADKLAKKAQFSPRKMANLGSMWNTTKGKPSVATVDDPRKALEVTTFDNEDLTFL